MTAVRRATFKRAWGCVRAAGVPLRPEEDAWRRYEALRGSWDGPSVRLRAHFGYPAFDDARRDAEDHPG